VVYPEPKETDMTEFLVEGMSCSHCVNVVTSAIHALDPAAGVLIDLGTKRVRIDSGVDRFVLAQGLRDAGYDPELLAVTNWDENL
jgi:copper chaperone CopZ